MARRDLSHLQPAERQLIEEFVQRLLEQFDGEVRSVILYGSKARGESTPDSDIDVLVVVESEDWRVHKQIRYLAVDVWLNYVDDDVYLSPDVWSTSRLQEMETLGLSLYRNIRRDGIDLLPLLDESAAAQRDTART